MAGFEKALKLPILTSSKGKPIYRDVGIEKKVV